jgi:WD40 repeat protein
VLEITLYVSILSIDIRRVELADFFTVNGGNDTSQLLPRPDNNASPERPNSSSLTRLRGVGAVHLGFGGSLPFILSVIITIIFALIGGVSNVADRTYAHTSIPSLLVDWRAAFRAPHTPDEARPTFLFLPPLTVVLDGWRGGSVGSSTEIPIVWVSTYLEGSGSTSSLVSTMTVMFILASAALTTCWLFQVPRRLNSWVFGLYGAGAPAFNAFGETQNCEVTTFVGHEQEIECVAVVASGDYQIEPMFATACLGGEIRIWDPETARCVEVLTSGGSARPTTEDSESVAPWCLAAHESFIVAGYASGVVKVWDLSSHRVVALPPSGPLPGEGEPSVRDGGGITAVVFFENTLVTASSTGVLQQWHFKYAPRTPQRSHGCTDTPHTEPYIPRVASLRSLVDCGSDAALCSRCGSHEVMAGGQLVRSGVPFLGLRRSSNTTTFTLGDDGEVLSAGNSPERPVSAVQRAPETSVLTFHRVFSKAVHRGPITQLLATQTQLVSASQDKLIKVYSRDLQCVRTFYGHEAGITCIAVCGSTSIISGSRDKTVRDWRVSDGSCANVFSGHTDAVLSVCMSDIRAVSCSHDDTIRIWSRSTGRCTQVLRDSTMQVALHPSSVLITASDGALTAWNLLGHVERLRTVSLANDHEPTNEGGVAGTRHLAIHNGTVFCDLGSHVKAVKLPFPSTSTTKTKEP